MAAKRKKQVPSKAGKAAPKPSRVPRTSEPVEFYSSKPVWSFSILDISGPPGFGWQHLATSDFDELHARFRAWETMTWKEILIDGKKRNHRIAVEDCFPLAHVRLKALKLEATEEVTSLSVNSRARVIGIRDREVFKILWWDHDHQVCPSPKKHT